MAEKQKVESVIYSAAVMVDPDGEVVADYQKVHLKGEQRLSFRPGYRYVTAETRLGMIGVLVGWDLAFPEAARDLALGGAEVVCVSGGWETPNVHEWRSLAFARAYENAVFLAACTGWAKSRPILSLARAWCWGRAGRFTPGGGRRALGGTGHGGSGRSAPCPGGDATPAVAAAAQLSRRGQDVLASRISTLARVR
jgi:predicted amidohydrolase